MTFDDLTKTEGQSDRVVYVRAMRPEEIPAELPENVPTEALYSIHDETGQRVGIAPGRDVAFLAARQHELTPVSVH
ncbi:MAG: DUF1150 family protein [Pikeienuella sp.]